MDGSRARRVPFAFLAVAGALVRLCSSRLSRSLTSSQLFSPLSSHHRPLFLCPVVLRRDWCPVLSRPRFKGSVTIRAALSQAAGIFRTSLPLFRRTTSARRWTDMGCSVLQGTHTTQTNPKRADRYHSRHSEPSQYLWSASAQHKAYKCYRMHLGDCYYPKCSREK